MHCCLVLSRSLRKQEKKILQVPPVTSFLNTSCTFRLPTANKNKSLGTSRRLREPEGYRGARGRTAGPPRRANPAGLPGALPTSLRGCRHAPACSELHAMERRGCSPARSMGTRTGHPASTHTQDCPAPCRGAPTERGATTTRPPKTTAPKHPEDSSQTLGAAASPATATSFRRGASIPAGTATPTLTAALSARSAAPSSRGRWGQGTSLPLRLADGKGTKPSPGLPFAPSPLPSWRPPPRSCPSSYGPFPSCRVLN